MISIFVSVLLLNLSLVTVNAGPVTIQKCKGSDAPCILQSTKDFRDVFVKGIPEYHIPPLEVLNLPLIDASTPNLKLKLSDLKVRGIDKCDILAVSRDVANKKLLGTVLCNIEADGKYEMKGKLLVIPIEGNGDLEIKANKIQVDIEADLEEKTGKDGKQHWSIKHWNYTYELKKKVVFKFENLFPGNKDLAQAAEDVISKNGNEIVAEVGEPVLKAGFEKLVTHVAHLFKAVPIEDLSLDN